NFVAGYYCHSTVPSPNFTDHYLLTLFCRFLSFSAAEKLIQLIYILSFSITFRLLVKSFNPTQPGLSIFAIPFAFSFLYYLGFYNFSLSFPILFTVIIYYHKWFSGISIRPSLSKYIVLSLISLLLYFTNGLAFLFAGLILFLMQMYNVLLYAQKKASIAKGIIKKLLLFLCIWLPGLICFSLFVYWVPMHAGKSERSFSELLQWLIDVRPLIVFGYKEVLYTRWISYAIVVGLSIAIYLRIKNKAFYRFHSSDVFIIAFIFTLVCYFIIPDGYNVGMMSVRLCTYLFVFLLIWLAMQKGIAVIIWLISITAITMHFILLINARLPVEDSLNKEAEVIQSAARYIEPESVVLTIDVTDGWLYDHFGDYIAMEKPMVVVPNYEADDSWFGIVWKSNMPQLIFNGRDSIAGYCNLPGPDHTKTYKEIDYMFVYGNYNTIITDNKWSKVKDGISKRYKITYASSDSTIHIFKLADKTISQLPDH
ncbi:MAG TPA: hypothetical protein VNY36_07680, partial [Bacteroidia bacterium]|nr:hypothetical protein [Bacteroidia bacterium]